MKKRLLLFALVLFLLPSVVFAKTINAVDIPPVSYNSTEVHITRLDSGDILNFEGKASVSIYIDSQKVDGCFGTNNECSLTYEADKSIVMSGYSLDSINASIGFISMDPKANIYSVDDLVEGQIYKTGDVIVFPRAQYSVYYYNEAEEYIKTVSAAISYKIGQYNNQDYTWKLSIVNGTSYAPISLALQAFSYVKPQFKLTCAKDSINYGEKTSCYVSALSQYQLEEVSFSLDFPSFKVSNVKAATNITKEDVASGYKFRIKDGYGNDGKEFKLMTFDLEGTKNENYVDDINITNIQYRDELYDGSYDVLKSNLKVNTKKLENPNTYRNLTLILLPILVLLISFGIVQLKKNKKEKI